METAVDREHTNLAGTMKLAQASISARHGQADRGADRRKPKHRQRTGASPALADAGHRHRRGAGAQAPPREKWRWKSFRSPRTCAAGSRSTCGIVMNNSAGEGQAPKPTEGRLQVIRKTGNREEMLSDQDVTVEPGPAGISRPRGNRAARLLHLRSPLRAEKPGRRHAGPEQPGHRVHARARQRPGPP